MFMDTSVEFLEVPEGVKIIGYNTFMGSDIEQIVMPSTLTSIMQDCVEDCPLKEIYMRAAKENYPESLLAELAKQTEATLYFYSETEPTEEGNFWRYVDGKPVIW